ncbi:hypothetical protein ACEPAF_8780 [Sanghuangporus sanghuang]
MAPSNPWSHLYKIADRFEYGKNLAREALNRTLRHPESGRWKTVPDAAPAKSLRSLFTECTRWSRLDWLSPKNWKRLHNALAEIIFPDKFQGLNCRFKLERIRAEKLGSETLDFVKNVSRKWSIRKGGAASIKEGIQNSIDLLEMMIQENLVEAILRKDYIQYLAQLCRKHRHIPRFLELEGLSFEEDASKNILDCGGSADIMLAKLNGRQVVVKVLRADKAIRTEMRKKKWSKPLHEEALNWIGLDYPGLNPFLGVTLKHPRGNVGIGLVFKFQELGNSVKFLAANNEIDRVNFVQAKAFYFIGTVHFLHQMGLVHADIKGANILVDTNKNLVLTDFGLMLRTLFQSPFDTPMSVTASSVSDAATVDGDCTLRFSSKERVFQSVRSEKDDVWAIGMTLIELAKLITGKQPFSDVYGKHLWFLNALARSDLNIRDAHLPSSVPPDLYHAINRCISPNPVDRPNTFELYTMMGRIAGRNALTGHMKEGFS